MHLWGISAHLGLAAAVALSYLCQLGSTTRPERWGRSATVIQTSRCTPAMVAAGLDGGYTRDVGTYTLLKACLILVSWTLPNLKGNLSRLTGLLFRVRAGVPRFQHKYCPSCRAVGCGANRDHPD